MSKTQGFSPRRFQRDERQEMQKGPHSPALGLRLPEHPGCSSCSSFSRARVGLCKASVSPAFSIHPLQAACSGMAIAVSVDAKKDWMTFSEPLLNFWKIKSKKKSYHLVFVVICLFVILGLNPEPSCWELHPQPFYFSFWDGALVRCPGHNLPKCWHYRKRKELQNHWSYQFCIG